MTDTATRKTMQDHERKMQERTMEDRLERFSRRYAPRDAYESDMFHRDLMMLGRAFYREATEPYINNLTRIASLDPFAVGTILAPLKEDGSDTA